jgi:hypothetical protein
LSEAFFRHREHGSGFGGSGRFGTGGRCADATFGPLLQIWQADGQLRSDLDLHEAVHWMNAVSHFLLVPPWRQRSAEVKGRFIARYEAISGVTVRNRLWYRAFHVFKMAAILRVGPMLVDAHLAGLADLAKVGVTWVRMSRPGDSLSHLLETLDSFGKQIISQF